MKRRPVRKASIRRNQKEMESLCGQPGPDDGIDPRNFFRPGRTRRVDRKDWQLCRQVLETLNFVLSGDSGDDLLRSLNVIRVVPAPDVHRLLVSVCPFASDATFSPAQTLTRLHQSVGRLRSEIARSISRRKVPDLTFELVLNPGSESLDQETLHDE